MVRKTHQGKIWCVFKPWDRHVLDLYLTYLSGCIQELLHFKNFYTRITFSNQFLFLEVLRKSFSKKIMCKSCIFLEKKLDRFNERFLYSWQIFSFFLQFFHKELHLANHSIILFSTYLKEQNIILALSKLRVFTF